MAHDPRVGAVSGRRAVLTQRWASIAWAHWRVEPAEVAALVPPSLRVDTFDGAAWVGLVPFQMEDLRLVAAGRRLPPLGSTRSFSEVNVRTYVDGPAGPGVWFHSLDATSRLAVVVARGLWALPYRPAAIDAEVGDDRRAWDVDRRGPGRVRGSLHVAVGEPVGTGALEAFLTARFRLYAPLGRRRLLSAPVRHRPWALRAATATRLDPGLVVAAGYRSVRSSGPGGGPSAPDHVVAADPVDVAIGLPSILRA